MRLRLVVRRLRTKVPAGGAPKRRFEIVEHARRLGVQLSPNEMACLRSDVARRDSHHLFRRSDFRRMVAQVQTRLAERETLVEYITKTDEDTAGQRLLVALDYLGTALFAIVGTQVAGQAGMNVVGAVLVGCVASMGGGTLNNLMTGNTRGGVFWMRNPSFLVVSIWVSLATFYLWPEYEEWRAQREFEELRAAAGISSAASLNADEFCRALEASPRLADHLSLAVLPRLETEAHAAIQAAPSLKAPLLFEWLSSCRTDADSGEPSFSAAELRAVARLSIMDSPLVFGLETTALGAVAVLGAQAGITRGVGPLGSIATGVTICFGGVLRDVLCHREVAIGAQSYALATAAGASVYVGLRQLVVRGVLRLPLLARILAAASTAVAQRLYVYLNDTHDHLLQPMRIANSNPAGLRRQHPPLAGSESLCEAAANNDVLELRILVRDMKCNADVPDYDRRTPLHLAAAEGSFEAVVFLVDDVRVRLSPADRWGRTPLDEAIANSHHRIVAYLRSRGATTASDQAQDECPRAR